MCQRGLVFTLQASQSCVCSSHALFERVNAAFQRETTFESKTSCCRAKLFFWSPNEKQEAWVTWCHLQDALPANHPNYMDSSRPEASSQSWEVARQRCIVWCSLVELPRPRWDALDKPVWKELACVVLVGSARTVHCCGHHSYHHCSYRFYHFHYFHFCHHVIYDCYLLFSWLVPLSTLGSSSLLLPMAPWHLWVSNDSRF